MTILVFCDFLSWNWNTENRKDNICILLIFSCPKNMWSRFQSWHKNVTHCTWKRIRNIRLVCHWPLLIILIVQVPRACVKAVSGDTVPNSVSRRLQTLSLSDLDSSDVRTMIARICNTDQKKLPLNKAFDDYSRMTHAHRLRFHSAGVLDVTSVSVLIRFRWIFSTRTS